MKRFFGSVLAAALRRLADALEPRGSRCAKAAGWEPDRVLLRRAPAGSWGETPGRRRAGDHLRGPITSAVLAIDQARKEAGRHLRTDVRTVGGFEADLPCDNCDRRLRVMATLDAPGAFVRRLSVAGVRCRCGASYTVEMVGVASTRMARMARAEREMP